MITLHRITKLHQTRSGIHHVLNGIDLTIEQGEKVGILGRNGAGKSTLIRILGGAESPTAGWIHRGMSISWPLAFSGGFQGSLTGLDNLKFISRVYGVDYRLKTDYVLNLLHKGFKGKYFPNEIIYHPAKKGNYEDVERAYSYALGYGAIVKKEVSLRKNRAYLWKYMKKLFRTIGGMIISKERRYYFYVFYS